MPSSRPLKFKDRLHKLFFWKQQQRTHKSKKEGKQGSVKRDASEFQSCFPRNVSHPLSLGNRQANKEQTPTASTDDICTSSKHSHRTNVENASNYSGKKNSTVQSEQISSFENSSEITATGKDRSESFVSNTISMAPSNITDGGFRSTRLFNQLQFGTDKQKQVALEQMFQAIKEDESASYKFARMGAIRPLVDFLIYGSDRAQVYASYSLSCMTGMESSRNELLRVGAVEAFIDLLERENANMVAKKGAMRAISKLVRGEEEAKLVVDSGGLKVISSLLSSQEQSILKRCLRALFFIAADKSDLQEQILSTTNCMPSIIKHLQSPNLDIQAEAADLLRALTEHPLCDEQIMKANGLVVLQEVARSDTQPKSKQCAVLALQRLAQRENMKQRILETGGEELLSQSVDTGAEIEQFVYVVSEGDPYTKVQAAHALADIVSDEPKFSKELAAHGAIEPLLQLLRQGEEQQSKHAASSALANLCQNDTVKQQILQAGAIPDFVNAVNACSGEYMEGPIQGLYQMALLVEAQVDMISAGAMEAFCWALLKGNNKTQLLACKGLIKFIVHEKTMSRSFIEQEYHSQVLHHFWKVEVNIQLLILKLIHKLSRLTKEYQTSMLQAGLIPILEYCKGCDQSELVSIAKMLTQNLYEYEVQLAQETDVQDQIGVMLQLMRVDIQISTPIEGAFRMVPRSLFVPQEMRNLAFSNIDIVSPEHHINLSTPCLDAMCLNALELCTGHAFLDVGCGTGYFTCLAAYMVGEKGAAVGIDVDFDTCHVASEYVDVLRQLWPAQKWMPTIQVEDVCLAMDSCEQYDRVHVGAACPREWLPELLRLLLPNGKMVVPCESKLLLITKEGGVENAEIVTYKDCATLQLPSHRKIHQQNKQQPEHKLHVPGGGQGIQDIPKTPRNDSANCGEDHDNYYSARSHTKKQPTLQQPTLLPIKPQQKSQIHLRESPSVSQSTPRSERADDLSYQRWKEAQINQDWLLSYRDIEICRNKSGKRQRLGEGGFGVVYKAVMNRVDEVAVKVVKTDAPKPKELELFKKEVQILTGLRHKNIVQFYGACLEPGSLFFVTELMKGGDLYNALRQHPDMMSWDKLGKKVALDIALGINYLHTRKPPMIHRDLKSPNVLLSEEGVAKVADVGMVRSQVKELVTAQPIMTPLWAAPEVVRHERASLKADIWSYGILIWELISGEDITEYQPLAFSRTAKSSSKKGKIMYSPQGAPLIAVKIYEECTRMRPDDRPSASKIVEWLRREGR
eukprot:TRINITY_DN2821_c1_g1_i7.p1 TRINITY_DN2821_c1_g1~~TRINITY_DN2821_c1_g1_i7.p1  ORF type:complete len:1255 (+),score=138.74 TRINITY_DN2821_c1_g1_i7:174-3938(+)